MDGTPKTLLEAITYFADPDRAHAYAVKLRWPNGVACPRMGCGSASVTYIKTRRIWRCRDCKRQFSAKVGTIFEDSPIPFTKWFPAIWMLANTKNGTSSHELGRAIGVTQKTAWFMFHRIRESMKIETAPLAGVVEADETYVGGKRKATMVTPLGFKKMKHGGGEGKATVFGMAERKRNGRKSRVSAMVVPNNRRSSLLPLIKQNVLPGSVLYTDALRSYRGLDAQYMHDFVDHSIEYARGAVHTNTIENFWSCLKRTLNGTYIAPRAFHLQAYVEEQVFRFNAREDVDAGRFVTVAKNADGRRLTWNRLTKSHLIWRFKPGRAARSPLNNPQG